MPQKSGKSHSVWQELKRRSVVRMTTVYSAGAFIILQLLDIIAQPLRLPDWTMTFMIILLCTGLIVTILLTWFYDITPAGIKKTKRISTEKHDENVLHAVSGRWRIATYFGVAIIIGLLAFNIISRRSLNENILKLEKSIAILPFRNDSPNDSTTYFINGVMEKVLNNIQMVKELRVIYGNVYRNNVSKTYGFSVRCLKD